MKKIKVIDHENIPKRLPITITLTFLLALDYWNAPQWAWGAAILYLILVWIYAITRIWNQNEIDIFNTSKKGTFKEKLKDAMDKAAEQSESKKS